MGLAPYPAEGGDVMEILRRHKFVVVFLRGGESVDFKVLHKIREERAQFLVLKEFYPCHVVRIDDTNDGVRIISDIKIEPLVSDFEYVREGVWRGTFALFIVKDERHKETYKFVVCLVREKQCYFANLVDLSWMYDKNTVLKTIFYVYDRGYIRPYP